MYLFSGDFVSILEKGVPSLWLAQLKPVNGSILKEPSQKTDTGCQKGAAPQIPRQLLEPASTSSHPCTHRGACLLASHPLPTLGRLHASHMLPTTTRQPRARQTRGGSLCHNLCWTALGHSSPWLTPTPSSPLGSRPTSRKASAFLPERMALFCASLAPRTLYPSGSFLHSIPSMTFFF